MQSLLGSRIEMFFSPWNKFICDLFPYKAMRWIFYNSVGISRQHFVNYNKSEFTEFLDVFHIHHKVHDAKLLINIVINKILKELETPAHNCVHINYT